MLLSFLKHSGILFHPKEITFVFNGPSTVTLQKPMYFIDNKNRYTKFNISVTDKNNFYICSLGRLK